MIQVDDEIADAERREFGEEGVGALAAFLAADETLAEDILFGEQADHVGGEAVVERKVDHRGSAAAFRCRGAERNALNSVVYERRGSAGLEHGRSDHSKKKKT